jgi:hypothetical protein
MPRRKPRLYEFEPEEVDVSIGSYNSFQSVPRDDKPLKDKLQIGFIRQKRRKKKDVRTTKIRT